MAKEAIGVEKGNRAVPPLQVTRFQVFFAARFEVREGVQLARAIPTLLGEPDLIPAKKVGTQKIRIVGIEDELGAVGIPLRIVEQADYLDGEQRMEAVVQLVDAQQAAAIEGAKDRG
jgi:hypothetical protein